MTNKKNLGDDLNDMLGGAKDEAKKVADKANEFAGEAKEKAKEFSNDAKQTASEFAGSAKDTLDNITGENKKVLAGLLGIFFGSLGIHKFILGYNKEGIILLIATFVTCGATSVIGFIEGIIYLTKSDADFYNTYQVGNKPWF